MLRSRWTLILPSELHVAHMFPWQPPPKSPRSGGADNNDEESDSDDEPESEVINSSMALMYPLVGSVALVTLYGAIKYFGPEAFNYVLSIVFGVAGIGSIYAVSV